jgi:hypothetical protein
MKTFNPFALALILSAASATSVSALSCNNKHPELCRKADLVAEIANYGTINAAGQFVPNPGVASSARTHFMNLATNSPVTVGQLVMMVKMGAISADGSFNPTSPLSLGFESTSVSATTTAPSLPPVGSPLAGTKPTAQGELSKLGTFDASGQFKLNAGVAANQKTNFYAINPVTGKASALSVSQLQLMVRLGAIKPDGSNDPSAFASPIVYKAPEPSIAPGVAAVNPAALSASAFDNLRAGQPGSALAVAQINRMIDGSGRPIDANLLTSFYRLRVVDGQQLYVQITQRELAQSIAGGLIGRDGTAKQDAGTGWGTAGNGPSGNLPVVVFLPSPTAPGPALVPGLAPQAPKPQAPPLTPQLAPNMVPQPMQVSAPPMVPQLAPSLIPQPLKTQAPPIVPQLVPQPAKAQKWVSTSPEKRVKNESTPTLAKVGSQKELLNSHFATSRVQKPSDCVTGGHGRQGVGANNQCMLPNDIVMECLTSGQRRRVSRGPDGTLNGVGLTESFRSVDEDVNSAPANHTFSSGCMISVQRPHL